MQENFSQSDAYALVDLLLTENDVVRIVDPVPRDVLYWPGQTDGGPGSPCLECNSVWGRTERCPNCSSLEAVKLQQRTFKIEINDRHVFWVQSRPLLMDGTPCVLETVNDVTEGLMVEGNPSGAVGDLIDSLNGLIVTDALTSLYNRRFVDDFNKHLQTFAQAGIAVNVAMVDLDNLKEVNDSYGHEAGDALIKDAAGFLKLHYDSRKSGSERYAIRYGGDELIAVACGLTGSEFEHELRDHYANMRRICYFGEYEIPFSMSIGTASSDEFGWDWARLVRVADERMYIDKRKGPRAEKA